MTLKNRSRIFAIITAMLISIAFMPVSTSGVYANTTDEIANENNVDDNADIVEEGEDGQDRMTVNVMGSEDIVYEKLDDTYHCYTDSNGETIKEEHDWSRCASPEYVDEDYHKVTYTCDKCGAILSWNDSHYYEEGPGEWVSYDEEEYGDAYYEPTFECECGAANECVDYFGHDWEYLYDESLYKKYNSTYHCLVTERCTNCGALKGFLVRHDDYEPCYYKYSKVDAKYHNLKKCCYDCGVVSTKKEKHSKAKTKVVRKATVKRKGKIQDICKCGAVIKTRTVSWKYNTKYSVSYNVTWNTDVYRNSKSVTVTLKNPVKGSTVIVQIGNKKYKKKVGKGKKVKVKIKKPKKYGKRIYIDVKYKGKWIGTTDSYGYDTVYYAKSIKKGMTKKQFKHTRYYWGSPDDTASASGGWTYWYYDDGSYIGFKKGKVKYWYNAD